MKKFIEQTANYVIDLYFKNQIDCNEMYETFINLITNYVHKHTEDDCVILEYDEDQQSMFDMIETTMIELKGKKIIDSYITQINDVYMCVVITEKKQLVSKG